MAATAELLYHLGFDGTDVPGVVNPWPGFEFPIEKWDYSLNPQSGAQSGINGVPLSPYVNEPFIPVIDGSGHGVGGAIGQTWRIRATSHPGRNDLQADLWVKFRNPAGFGSNAAAGVIVRFYDAKNCVVARVTLGGATPVLSLVQIVANVETVLGTYSGAGLTNAMLSAGVAWRLRCKDDGANTQLTVYTSPTGASSKGTQRITWNGTLPANLRGNLSTGVEMIRAPSGSPSSNAVAWIDNHDVYDLADENTEDTPGDGSGWILELDGTQYTRAQLAAYDPPIRRFIVWQQFGPEGGGCRIESEGDWVMKAGLKPGMRVRVFHHGECRFRGVLGPGQAMAAPRESQVWEAYDPLWLSALVNLAEDDGTATMAFNVFDEEDDLWLVDRQEMTVGQIIRFLGDRYIDGNEGLRAVGAAPEFVDMFVQSELDAMDAVFPNIALAGNFQAAILQLVDRLKKWQPFVDPVDGVWHFRDLTAATAQDVRTSVDWVLPKVTADPRKSYTRVKLVGSSKEDDDPVTLKLSDGTLKPIWTTPQEAAAGAKERRKGEFAGEIGGGGAEMFEGVMRTYVFVSILYGFTPDEWRGAIESIASAGQFVVGNRNVGGATRIYFGPSAWPGGTPPVAGTKFLLTMLDAQAMKYYSSIGVGRAFYIPRPITTCGGGKQGLYGEGISKSKDCGSAFIKGRDPVSGRLYADEYDFQVYTATAKAHAAGFCQPIGVIAKKPLPPIALINFFPPGSAPESPCNPTSPSQDPAIDVELQIKRKKEMAPERHTPASGFSGEAFDEWGVKREKVIQVPDFVDDATQGDGIQKACDALHAILSQRALLLEVGIATPWHPHASFPMGTHAQGYPSSTWAGLTKTITISSSRRATNLETGTDRQVYRVEWDVMGNRTTLQAGTAAGWLNIDAELLARTYTEKGLLTKTARMVKDAIDQLSCLLRKPADRIGGESGITPGCQVPVIDAVRRSVKSVEQDDEQKKDNIAHGALVQRVDQMLGSGLVDTEFPGAPIEMPGFDGAAAQQVGDGGRVLRSLPVSPLQGASRYANGDRGPYGGPIVTDPVQAGQPPDVVARFAWGTVRKRGDGAGSARGGYDLEWSPNDAQGAPTGVWNPLRSGADINAGAGPHLRHSKDGSYAAQLRDRADVLAEVLGVQTDAAGAFIEPAQASAPGYPDGPPADLVTALLVASAASSHLFPVWSSLHDPGGLVFSGPKSVTGADAEALWQVMMPERVLAKVLDVGLGGGGARNGGSYALDTSGPGGTTEVLHTGTVVHKQVEAGGLSNVGVNPVAAVPIADDSPFGLLGPGAAAITAGWAMGVVAFSGAGARLELPAYSRGVPAFTFHLMEDPFAVPGPGGLLMGGVGQYAYQASPWGAPVASAPTPVLTTAPNPGAAYPAKGVFLMPGGAVPPGLRRPFGIVVAFQRQPGVGGVDAGAGALILQAIGVEVVVTETGYAVFRKEGIGAAVTVKDNRPWRHELVAMLETITWRLEHVEAESVFAIEGPRADLDPPVVVFEGLDVAIDEAVFMDLHEEGEGVAIAIEERWVLS